jgi:hypothetical protein
MKTVEHKRKQFEIPTAYWADEIEVLSLADRLSVSGQKLFPSSKGAKERDLISGYLCAISGGRVADLDKAAHLVFANSMSAEDLTRFVERYGPVLAETDSVEIRPPATEAKVVTTELKAIQRWEVLRREQRTLRAALKLFEQIRLEKPNLEALFDAARDLVLGTSSWIAVCEQELSTKSGRPWQNSPSWTWTAKHQGRAQMLMNPLRPLGDRAAVKRAKAQGHELLCHLLNAFPVRMTQYRNVPLEMPSEDVSFGILPVLYFLLRNDYLWSAKVARCAWKDCARWFRVGNHDSPCCSEQHSLKHRQWVYYHEGKGKQTRRKRRKRVKNSE